MAKRIKKIPVVEVPKADVDLSNGTMHTHEYPGENGKIWYYTFRVGRSVDEKTFKITGNILIVSTTVNDPRSDDFAIHEKDTYMVIPMTESSVYALMGLATVLRQDMVPETSAILTTMFDKGHFVRN